jgi:Protein of unknown function (DUF1569)
MKKTMTDLSDHAVRSSITQRLTLLTPLNAARWGRMSAHQAVCHLSDSFRLPLGYKSASDATGVLQRSLIKWIALYAPLPWPKGVPTRPEMSQGVGGTLPLEFAGDRAALAGLIEEFARMREFPVPHPIFGRLTAKQWMRWGFLHSDHHLRQFGV